MTLSYTLSCQPDTRDTASEQILTRATNIEKTVFNAEGGMSTGPYRAKMRSLYLNLKDKGNPALRASVVSGDLAVSRLCTMSTAVRGLDRCIWQQKC